MNMILLLLYYFPRQKQVYSFHLIFYHNGPHSIHQGTSGGFCQLLIMSVLIMHSGTWEITTMGLGTHWTQSEVDLS